MVADFLIALVGESLAWLANGESQQRIARWVKRFWCYSVIGIAIMALVSMVFGSLTGLLAAPDDTKRILTWACGLVAVLTLVAGFFLLIAFMILKFASTLDRGTGNTNVHPD